MNNDNGSNNKLKCGLEIHQRLETKKLFCECYADTNKPIAENEVHVERRLRPASGELGKTDVAASFEATGEKVFEYTSGEKTSCLVELDEEPPHGLNEEALKTALEIAKALNSKIVNEIHVMRKTIVDGSVVSGFQRTALIAVGGKIKVDGKNIGIQTVSLEEESSRIIERQDSKRQAYGLDRQGIPLVEIATSPDIGSAEMAKKVALELGEILRNTGKVQRGLGTIRQDINISIEGGERIEIKGCQDLNAIEELVKNEVQRQQKLLEIKEKLKERKAKIEFKLLDATKVFQNTASKIISNSVAGGAKVMALKLAGFGGLLGIEIQPSFRFGKEAGDYAKIVTGVKGVMHSDEPLEKFGISPEERKTLGDLLNCSSEDAFVMCIENEGTARKALEAVYERALKCPNGVPAETRKAEGSLTRFMRPLAGSARMYPETDSLPRTVTNADIASLQSIESPAQKVSRYIALGLNEELAKRMAGHYKFQLFEKIVATSKCDAATAAVTLLETLTALRRDGVNTDAVPDEQITQVLAEYGEKTIAKPAIPVVLKLLTLTPGKSVNKIIAENNLQKIEGEALKKAVMDNQGDIAAIMKKFKANIDPSQLSQAITELRNAGKLANQKQDNLHFSKT